ncbi:carbohydrate ABC transporter permease [Phycicoccus sp. MAQZ13P-2]|uniref:carbohydrate ABC transporter permease n=1 Tax=Phycicoccus mangrovi TaxID=2840470 RepID=UPI001C000A52|nr:carbohydrate ABC transporter permease [Phycicoccus mangrovi]MBT9273633.1 carbohydrate ABC transporter permease [Phycicoccus mangrovi]
MMTTTSTRRTPRRTLAYVVLSAVGVFAFAPAAWMLVTAFTADSDIFQIPPSIGRQLTISHFADVLSNPVLLQFIANGFGVSIVTATLSVLVGCLAGYSFSKFRYSGRSGLMYLLLIAQMVPEVLLLLTLYTSFGKLGLLNTYAALVLSYATFTLPLSVFMMKNTFDGLPDELLEAARIDGGSEGRVLWSVALPLVRTAMVAVGMFAFIRAWNDLVYSLTLVDTPKQTLPAGLTLTYLGEFQNQYGQMMAASLISSLPVVVIFLMFQKHFTAGALAGSIK